MLVWKSPELTDFDVMEETVSETITTMKQGENGSDITGDTTPYSLIHAPTLHLAGFLVEYNHEKMRAHAGADDRPARLTCP